MKQAQKLDTSCTVETPEGVEFSSSVAGPVPRVLAYSIDLLWRSLIILVLSICAIFLHEVGIGIILISTFLLEWFYPVYFEVFKNGQTPGKKVYGIKVVNEDFTPVTFANSCIRNLLRAADFLPFFYAFGLVSMACGNKFQRLGDLAAGTIVTYQLKDQNWGDIESQNITPAPPKFVLSLDEQRSYANFLLRTDVLSDSRQIELANILEPVLDKEGERALRELKSIGAWLLGKK